MDFRIVLQCIIHMLLSMMALHVRGAQATVSSVSLGADHTCALLAGGEVKCWGGNSFGQLGYDVYSNFTSPPTQPVVSGVQAVLAGGYSTCAIVESMEGLLCWGANGFGQLGLGNTRDSPGPPPSPIISAVSAVAVSRGWNGFTCALLSSGSLRCWGDDDAGQLGLGGGAVLLAPWIQDVIEGISGVTAGFDHVCVLTVSNGGVKCWGGNSNGQLGTGDTIGISVPPVNSVMNRVLIITAGVAFTCSVTINGDCFCWGANNKGQLGNGGGPDLLSPALGVPSAVGVIDVSAGDAHVCALLSSASSVVCWGSNAHGQLGIGSTSTLFSPPAPILSGVLAVSCGGSHTCATLPAVTADGSGLRCWGSGASGQLGTDDTLDLLSPPPSDIVFPIPSSVPLTTLLSIVIPISVCVAIAATVTVVLVRKWRKKKTTPGYTVHVEPSTLPLPRPHVIDLQVEAEGREKRGSQIPSSLPSPLVSGRKGLNGSTSTPTGRQVSFSVAASNNPPGRMSSQASFGPTYKQFGSGSLPPSPHASYYRGLPGGSFMRAPTQTDIPPMTEDQVFAEGCNASDFEFLECVSTDEDGAFFLAKCRLRGHPNPQKVYAVKMGLSFPGMPTSLHSREVAVYGALHGTLAVSGSTHAAHFIKLWACFLDLLPTSALPFLPREIRAVARPNLNDGNTSFELPMFSVFDFRPRNLRSLRSGYSTTIPFSALAPIALSLFDIACCLDELNILHRNLNFEALRVLEGDINIAVGGLGHALILPDGSRSVQVTRDSVGGKESTMCPEVLNSLRGFSSDPSLTSVTVNYSGQASFELGVLLSKLILGRHPLGDYPALFSSPPDMLVSYSEWDVLVLSPSERSSLSSVGYPDSFLSLLRSLLAPYSTQRPAVRVAKESFVAITTKYC